MRSAVAEISKTGPRYKKCVMIMRQLHLTDAKYTFGVKL